MAYASNHDLAKYLASCPNEVIYDLVQIVGDRLGFNDLKKRFATLDDVPVGVEKEALISRLIDELGYFGSNNLAYWSRWVTGNHKAVGYHEIVFDVAKSLNRRLKMKLNIPRVASVAERERMICGQLLGIAFQGKSEEEIARMLSEAGLESDATKAAAIKAAIQGGAGGVIIALVKILGKKTVTTFLSAMVVKIVATRIGKEVAQKLIISVLKQVPQKTVAAFMTFVGAALIAKDILDLADPATRVTIPAVTLIASARAAEELGA